MSSAVPDAAGWIEACDLDALVPGDVLRFEHAGQTYAIYRTQIGQLFASDGFCTHGRAPWQMASSRGRASSAPSTTAALTSAMAPCAGRPRGGR